MAETTDRPRGVDEAAGEHLETYRPLSLLALAGFGLAVLYALIVLVGGGIALYGRTPWLMPAWSFLLPLAALVVCWAARNRIRDSEDTLSGVAFTTWGFRLTIVLGLTYTAYYTATFFAVRGHAFACADAFFEQLKQGNTGKAFLLSTGIPLKDVEDKDLRNILESRFNNPAGGPGSPGAYSQFRHMQFVRFIQTDGPRTQIAPLGVHDWEYGKGGYKVVLRYRVVTSMGEFEMRVETLGRDPKPGDPRGRQWQVVLNKAETGIVTMHKTALGDQVMKRSASGNDFVNSWVEKINRQRWSDAYLDTLPLAERERLLKGRSAVHLMAAAPLAGLAPLVLHDENCRAYLNAAHGLQSAKLIRLDLSFWATESQKKGILERIERTFKTDAAGNSPPVTLGIQQQNMPMIREKDGRLTMVFDVMLRYMAEDNPANIQYLVEGQLILESDEKDTDQSPLAWHVAALEVESGRTPPPMPNGGRTPPSNAQQMGGGMR
jgi:hypothetical protein